MENGEKHYNKKLVWSAVIIFALALSILEVYKKESELATAPQAEGPQEKEEEEAVTSAERESIPHLKIAGQILKVDLAVTEGERERGLSGRAALGENEGMIFIFDQPGKYGFWMKDMNFPIDIIWLAPRSLGEVGIDDLEIVFIKKNATPESYPEVFASEGDAQYVLEVNAGFADLYNLQIGDRVKLLR